MATAGNPRTGSSNHGPQSMTTTTGLYQCGVTCTLAEGAIAWKRRIAATWTRAGTTCTVTTTSHGLSAAGTVIVQSSTSSLAFGSGTKTIASTPTADTFTFTCNNAGAASGTCDWTQTYDLSLIAGDPLNLVATMTGKDDHHAFAVGVDDQGRVHIMGNTFHSPFRYVRSAATSGIPNITSWSDATSTLNSSATGVDNHTYYQMARHSTGLLMSMDQREVTTDGLGNDRLLFRLPAGAGTTWSPVVGSGEYMIVGRSTSGLYANRCYSIGMTVDRNDRVHFAGIWRTSDEDVYGVTADGLQVGQKEPFYFYSDDLVTFYNVQGSVVACPIYYANKAQTAITSAPGFSAGFGQGVCVDKDGYPHIVVHNGAPDGTGALVNPTTGQTRSKWVDLYWNGTAWTVQDITGGGSAFGPSLHRIRDDIYVVSCASSRAYLRSNHGAIGSVKVLMGGPVQSTASAGILFEANPDPILLWDDELCLNVADGDTPMSYSFGNHARRIAS